MKLPPNCACRPYVRLPRNFFGLPKLIFTKSTQLSAMFIRRLRISVETISLFQRTYRPSWHLRLNVRFLSMNLPRKGFQVTLRCPLNFPCRTILHLPSSLPRLMRLLQVIQAYQTIRPPTRLLRPTRINIPIMRTCSMAKKRVASSHFYRVTRLTRYLNTRLPICSVHYYLRLIRQELLRLTIKVLLRVDVRRGNIRNRRTIRKINNIYQGVHRTTPSLFHGQYPTRNVRRLRRVFSHHVFKHPRGTKYHYVRYRSSSNGNRVQFPIPSRRVHRATCVPFPRRIFDVAYGRHTSVLLFPIQLTTR